MEHEQKIKILSKTELEFMKVIWDNPDGILSEIIFQKFNQARTTKSNVLRSLVQKGCAKIVKQGCHTLYIPKLSQMEYENLISEQKIGKLEGIIASFFQKKQLSNTEIDRVKDFLENLKKE